MELGAYILLVCVCIYIYVCMYVYVAFISSGHGHSSQDPQTASVHPRYPRARVALPLPRDRPLPLLRDRLGDDSWLRSMGLGFKVWGLGRLCDTNRMSQWHKVDREGRRRERETTGQERQTVRDTPT